MKRMLSVLCAVLVLTACGVPAAGPSSAVTSEGTAAPSPTPTPVPTAPPDPVEQQLAAMTVEQKVGQLFVVRPDALDPGQTQSQIDDPYAEGATTLTEDMRSMLARYPVGGIALFKKNITDPEQLKTFIRDLQAASETPLFMTVDEEGGLIARLANHPAFTLPQYESATAVGTQGEAAARAMGETIGAYLREYGFNVDFAPVADVNTNPDNPVIGSRAFSSDAAEAAVLAAAMASGLQTQGILPVLKHFPGHGDTAEDSHLGMAVLNKTQSKLESCEWLPYGIDGTPPLPVGSYAVMVGHISTPAITGDDTPATLNAALVNDVLKARLYDPLIITDSLAMQAITDRYSAGEAAVLALQAGCDVLLMPGGLAEAYDAVLAAVTEGTLPGERLDASVRKILQYKERYIG